MNSVMFKMLSGLTVVGSVDYSRLVDLLANGDLEWVEIVKVSYPSIISRDALRENSSYISEFAMINLSNVECFELISKGDNNERCNKLKRT